MRLKWIVLIVVLAAALGGAVFAYLANQHTRSPLTGLPLSGSVANRRPVAVMIDNFSPDARPQTGLDRASLVFETLAEGGITRFMAVFLDHDAPVVGPVRSTRLYFDSWAAGLGVIFGHDGGNVDALQALQHLTSIFNIDADRTFGPFYRSSSRLAPHNEYTSTGALRSFAAAHGGSTTGAPPSFTFKNDALPFQRPSHFTLAIDFSYGDYDILWQYNPASNTYRRFMGGVPHVDAVSGKQLTAKNVVVMRTTETAAYDPFTPGAIHLQTEGSGPATVYRDGGSISGSWSKPSASSPLRWLSGSGQPIPLDRGTTWVEVVPNGASVSTS